jgi:thiamine transport system permease protein
MAVFDRNEPPLPILYSFKAIILAHGFYNFPVAFRIISGSWETIPRSNYDSAELLGGRGFTLFRTVTLPYSLPALLSSAVLIFLYCFGSFAIILVLGGGPRFTTIEVEMYNLMRVNLDLGKAGALGFLSTLFSLILLYLHMVARERSTREEKREVLPARCLSGEGAIVKFFSAFYLILMAAIVILPLVAVLFRSFTSARDQTEFSIAAYRSLFTGGKTANTIGTALRNSLLYALLTVCVALPLGTAVSYVSVRSRFGKGFETLAMLPIAVSSMVVALGYALIRSRLNPQGWTGSALSVILAHSVMAYPFVARTLTAGLGSLPSSYREAASSLGASPFRAFISVELPLLSRAIASASAFAFPLGRRV